LPTTFAKACARPAITFGKNDEGNRALYQSEENRRRYEIGSDQFRCEGLRYLEKQSGQANCDMA
jgi:hypothetical protein